MIMLQQMWSCPNCRETVERHFRCCWNCGGDERGNPDPSFTNQSESNENGSWPRSSPLANFAWMILAVCSFIAIMATAISLESLLPEPWNIRLSLIFGLFLLCLMTAVAINVASRLYLWVREYLYSEEPRYVAPDVEPLDQITDSRKQDE